MDLNQYIKPTQSNGVTARYLVLVLWYVYGLNCKSQPVPCYVFSSHSYGICMTSFKSHSSSSASSTEDASGDIQDSFPNMQLWCSTASNLAGLLRRDKERVNVPLLLYGVIMTLRSVWCYYDPPCSMVVFMTLLSIWCYYDPPCCMVLL